MSPINKYGEINKSLVPCYVQTTRPSLPGDIHNTCGHRNSETLNCRSREADINKLNRGFGFGSLARILHGLVNLEFPFLFYSGIVNIWFQAQHNMKDRLWSYAVVSKGAVVLHLLPSKEEALLIWSNSDFIGYHLL